MLLNIIRKYGNHRFRTDQRWNVKRTRPVIWFYIWTTTALLAGSILKVTFACIKTELHLIYFSFIQKFLEFLYFFSLHAKVTPIVPDARVLSTYLLGNHCLADVVVRTHKEDLNKSVCVQIDGTTIRYGKPFKNLIFQMPLSGSHAFPFQQPYSEIRKIKIQKHCIFCLQSVSLNILLSILLPSDFFHFW